MISKGGSFRFSMEMDANPPKVNFNGLIGMSSSEFDLLGAFITRQVGIKMPPFKRVFLQCRLQKRLHDLNMSTFTDYINYLFSPIGCAEEMPQMIDAISTNTTEFFREVHHFDFLYHQGLEEYIRKTGKTELAVWSAGCSTGEEPYSIAITLKEFSLKSYINYRILATDISEPVLQHAALGIYTQSRAQSIPAPYHRKYLLRGTGEYENRVRICGEIRDKVSFCRFNLRSKDFGLLDNFDMIFCRNVLIYFERNIQKLVLEQLCNQLVPGGYLFLGHSESITGMNLPLVQVSTTVFQKIPDFC